MCRGELHPQNAQMKLHSSGMQTYGVEQKEKQEGDDFKRQESRSRGRGWGWGVICFWSGRSRQRASGVLANALNLDLGHGFISVHFVIIC